MTRTEVLECGARQTTLARSIQPLSRTAVRPRTEVRTRTVVRPQHTPRMGTACRLALLVQNFILPYTPLRKLRCVPLRIAVGATDDCRRSSDEVSAKRAAEGGAPSTAVPPEERPNIHLAGAPKQGRKAQIKDTPRLSPPTHATGGNGGRLALLRCTPLRKLRCVPLRIARLPPKLR
jgi:hypothetical protein